MRYLATMVCLLCGSSALAEPYSVWEDAGWIWARDQANGHEWIISDWGGCSEPAVEAYTAVWVTTNTVPAIYGYDFDNRFPHGHLPVVISPPGRSEPQVSVVDTAGYGDYWVAWRQEGGIWAQHLKPPVSGPGFEVLTDYTGWYDLQADELVYDGGRITLEVPPPPDVPEPGTLVLLSIGNVTLTVGWWRRKR